MAITGGQCITHLILEGQGPTETRTRTVIGDYITCLQIGQRTISGDTRSIPRPLSPWYNVYTLYIKFYT